MTESQDTVRGADSVEIETPKASTGRGIPLPSQSGGLVERRKLRQRGQEWALAENGFGAF